MEIYPLNKT